MSLPNTYALSPAEAEIAIIPPRRRQHAVQPPNLLTTSLGQARNNGLGIGGLSQTPISSTTLSTPFSTYPQSAYSAVPPSPGGAMRGTSPMAFRSQSGFSAAYNPQQWGPVSHTSPASGGEHGHDGRSSRVVALAPRPVGPDGRDDCTTYGALTD
jgi:hypothetical protein